MFHLLLEALCLQTHFFLAFPDVQIKDVTPDWEFVVMACDGIWDVMTNEV